MCCHRSTWMEGELRTWRALLHSALNNPKACRNWVERCQREVRGWERCIALL